MKRTKKSEKFVPIVLEDYLAANGKADYAAMVRRHEDGSLCISFVRCEEWTPLLSPSQDTLPSFRVKGNKLSSVAYNKVS
jgi:hypothetical protein